MSTQQVYIPEGYKIVVQKQRKKSESGVKKMGKESKLEKIFAENPDALTPRQIYTMKWRAANREKINAYALKYYHEHKPPILLQP